MYSCIWSIYFCSMAGHRTINNKMNSFYQATKCAVKALTEAVRCELRGLKSNIRVTVSTFLVYISLPGYRGSLLRAYGNICINNCTSLMLIGLVFPYSREGSFDVCVLWVWTLVIYWFCPCKFVDIQDNLHHISPHTCGFGGLGVCPYKTLRSMVVHPL